MVLTLNRPEKRNAISDQMILGIEEFFTHLRPEIAGKRPVRLDADLPRHDEPLQPIPERMHCGVVILAERRMHGGGIMAANGRHSRVSLQFARRKPCRRMMPSGCGTTPDSLALAPQNHFR